MATSSNMIFGLSNATPDDETTPGELQPTIGRENALRARLLAWINDPAAPIRRSKFSGHAAREALGVASYRVNALLRQLAAEGIVAPVVELDGQRHRGWSLCGTVVPRRTLADLMALVEAAPQPDPIAGPAKRGRHGHAADEESVTALSPAQRRDIKGLLGLIAERAPEANGDPARVTSAYLGRRTVHQGRRIWALETEVPTWADERARDKAKARGTSWHPSQNADTRIKHLSALRLVMRFAVSAGWLIAADTEAPIVRRHAAEWHPLVVRWRAKLARRMRGTSEVAIRVGLQTLALYATRRGELGPRQTDWCALLDEIERDSVSGVLRGRAIQHVRFVWRQIGLLRRLRSVPRAQEQRLSVVPSFVIHRTVASIGTARCATDIDFTGWDHCGRYLYHLIEGEYGLRRLIWFTGGAEFLVAGDASMPKRAYERHYRRRPRRRGLTPTTVDNKLRQFGLLVGWAVRHDGADFSEEGLDTFRSLMAPDRLARFTAWRNAQPQYLTSGTVGVGNNNLRGITATCRRALADLQILARHKNDDALADELADTTEVVERLVAAAQTQGDTFRDCLAINEAWRADGLQWGLEKLVRLRDLLIREACEAAGGISIAEQLSALRAWNNMPANSPTERRLKDAALEQMTWRRESWATAVRRAMLVQLVRKVPMREKALRHLTDNMLQARDQTGRTCAPWEAGAAILVQVPGEFNKNGEPYRVAYVARDAVGQRSQEEGAARWLLELMLGPGGARSWFAEQAGAGVECNLLFPACARRGATGHGVRKARTTLAMADGGITSDWRVSVTMHGPELGVDVERLRSIQGGLGIHSVRYLFGRYWAAVQGKLDYTADMLHHGDLVVTKARYVGTDPTAASHDVSEIGGTPSGLRMPADIDETIDVLRRENEELRRRLAAQLDP